MDDEITEEIRRIRRQVAAEQDNDIAKIMADLRAREATDGSVYVSFPKRPPKLIPAVTVAPVPTDVAPPPADSTQ
jgi:hypothetical protein